jgi:mono/diheme cytochrome c family protein
MRWMGLTVISVVIAAPLLCSNTHAGNPSPVSGEEIYDTYCGSCHGFNGSPLLPNTPDFAGGERMDKSDSELLDSIRAGKGRVMPAWLGVLSDEECEAVLQYIREILS